MTKSFLSLFCKRHVIEKYMCRTVVLRILVDKTLEEASSRVKPKIRHLKICRCPIYIHVCMERKKILEPS
jgi:hypothetical protein